MQRNYSMLNGAVSGAVMIALLGVAACAVDEAAPADQGRSGVLQSQAIVSSDADIAAVLSAANEAVIGQSQLALTRAREPSVLNFAQSMISEHGEGNQHLNELFQRLGIAPQNNPVSTALSTGATTTTLYLQNQPPETFDRAYMEVEIESHQRGIEMLDTQLLPLAQNPELRAALVKLREELARHNATAQQILASLP